MRLSFFVALATLLSFVMFEQAQAATIFSGSGNNPEASANASGEASFSISGNTLTLLLKNTTSPRTTAQGNALTGVTFDIMSASPTLTLTSTALNAGSLIWTSELASNSVDPLAGSWTTMLGGAPLGAYGAATTGFNNRFNGGSISLGNASPDYGVVAANTFNGTNVAFGGSLFPFIQDTLKLTFTGISGVSESQIKNVTLLFGTNGTGIIPGTGVPEPNTLALLLLAGICAIAGKRNYATAKI